MTTTAESPAVHAPQATLGGTESVRRLGVWLARTSFGIGVAYVISFIVGFASMGDLSKPLTDPYLAIAEILIVFLAPVLVLLMVVVHQCAPERVRIYSTTAVGWTVLAAGFTITVHLVELMAVRRIPSRGFQDFQNLFGWHWPSVFYAIDIVAWDVFFGLALLFAATVFHASRHRAARNGLLLAGALSLLGLVGPAINHIAWRELGILGYAIVFPITCLVLSRAFKDPVEGS